MRCPAQQTACVNLVQWVLKEGMVEGRRNLLAFGMVGVGLCYELKRYQARHMHGMQFVCIFGT